MLGGLALKRRWQQRRRAAGKPADKPNLVMGINVQVCWEKFCNYWDVEPRFAPMEGGRLHLAAEEAVALCDENTIGVVASSARPSTAPTSPSPNLRGPRRAPGAHGLDIPVHVDAASGGFVAPFIDPDLEWDFRLPRVPRSTPPATSTGCLPRRGLGVWRAADDLPEDLVFRVNYLGEDMPTFALNFSRPGAQVIAQYYTFLRLG